MRRTIRSRVSRCFRWLRREASSKSLDDRSGRLILGEPSQHGRHRVGGDKAASQERQEDQHHWKVAGRLDTLADEAEGDRQPDHGDGDQDEECKRRGPLHEACSGPEADGYRYGDDDNEAHDRLKEAAENMTGQDGRARDRHRSESCNDPGGHIGCDGDGSTLCR